MKLLIIQCFRTVDNIRKSVVSSSSKPEAQDKSYCQLFSTAYSVGIAPTCSQPEDSAISRY
jgi:hypothetical protein